jgi:hypothetical protein
MPRAGFEPAIPATKRPQTYTLDSEATGIGVQLIYYSGRKITESLGNVTVRGEKKKERARGSAMVSSLSQHV